MESRVLETSAEVAISVHELFHTLLTHEKHPATYLPHPEKKSQMPKTAEKLFKAAQQMHHRVSSGCQDPELLLECALNLDPSRCNVSPVANDFCAEVWVATRDVSKYRLLVDSSLFFHPREFKLLKH